MRWEFENIAASQSGVDCRGNTKHKTNSFYVTSATTLKNAATEKELILSMYIKIP
jgi:hypothetical protein